MIYTSMDMYLQQQCAEWVQAIDSNLQFGTFENINEIRVQASSFLQSVLGDQVSAVSVQLQTEILAQQFHCKMRCTALQQSKQQLTQEQTQLQVASTRMRNRQFKPMPRPKELVVESARVGISEAWNNYFEIIVEDIAEIRTILQALSTAR